MSAIASPASPPQRLSFGVSGAVFSVPAADVLEVQRTPALTRVPNGSTSLAGLMNYHGNAIAVVRVSALLKLSDGGDGTGEARVVVIGQSPPVGLLVDQVFDIADDDGSDGRVRVLDVAAELAEHFTAQPEHTPRTRQAARQQAVLAPAAAIVALLAFRASGQRYALPLASVAEVLVLPGDLALRHASNGVALGMMDYRDGVLPLISAAALLGLAEGDGRRFILVVHLAGARIGLVTNAIDGVVRLPETSIEAVPAILQRGGGEAEIEAIARLGERTLLSILSPTRLFARSASGLALQSSSTGTPEMPETQSQASEIRFVVFRLGGESYALPINAVDEIVRLPEMLTRVPGAPEFVAGMMNLRGRALPVIDQRRRFSVLATQTRGRVIVVTVGELQAGFVVDAVSQILSVLPSEVMPAPRLPGEGAEVFDRVAPSGGAMILVINPAELLQRAERDLIAAFKPPDGWAGTS